jgi:hypothetical protein
MTIKKINSIYIEGVGKNLDIIEKEKTGTFYANLYYTLTNYNGKTKETKTLHIDIFEEAETIFKLLGQIQKRVSLGKNFHNKKNGRLEWEALVCLKKARDKYNPQLNYEENK